MVRASTLLQLYRVYFTGTSSAEVASRCSFHADHVRSKGGRASRGRRLRTGGVSIARSFGTWLLKLDAKQQTIAEPQLQATGKRVRGDFKFRSITY
jgi:hypothetical protein